MKRGLWKIVWMGVAALLASAAGAAAQYDYIDIRNPSLKKIPIAIPNFRVSPQDSVLSLRSSDQAAEYLDFTGYFKVLEIGRAHV